MRRFKKKLGNILLLSCLLFSTGATAMVSSPHVVYADDIDKQAEVQPPNKVNNVEISEKPETLRGAIASAVYSKDVSGGVRKFYIPYFNISGGSPVLAGVTTGEKKYYPLTVGDQGGKGDTQVGYFSASEIGSSKTSNALARQDEAFMQTFYKANDGYWYKDKEGKDLKAYYPVTTKSNNLKTGSEWQQKDFNSTDEFKKAQSASMVVFVPVADIKTNGDKFDKGNSYAVRSNLTKKQAKKQNQADRKKEQQENQRNQAEQFASQYPNVGDRPSTNTLLAYIMYTKGGSGDDAIKDIDISYGEIKYYPAPSSNVLVNGDAYKSNEAVKAYAGNGETKGAYIPNSINMAGAPQPEGKTLANMLKVYGGWGFISVSSTATDTNSTTSNDIGSILSDIWNNNNGWYGFIGNVVLTIISPILWLLSMVLDVLNSVANAFLGFITGLVNLFGDPIGILFFKAKGESGSENWLLNLAINIKDYLFTNETIADIVETIQAYQNFIYLVWLLLGLLSLIYRMVFRKGKYGQTITKWFFRISAPVVMIIVAGIVTGMPLIGEAGYKAQDEVSDSEIDMLKYGVAYNFDLREAYNFAGKDGSPKYQELIDKDDIDIDSWAMTSKQIKDLNQRIEAKLGSELSADLSQHNTQGATFDVNTYLSGIAQASKLANVNRTGNSVASNDLPSSFVKNGFMNYRIEGEHKEKTKFTIYGAPMLKISGGSQQSADFIPVGYQFDGYPYIFTQNDASIKRQEEESESASDENKSTELAYLSGTSDAKAPNYKKGFYIGFYGVYWEATPVTLSQPWTYLYGANTNNNAITERPSTYMYGAGKSTQIANLRKQQGSNLEDDDKAPETVTAPPESEDGTGYKSVGREHYFYWKYINAYNLALINKYMGTKSDMDVADLQLSNQSVVFLLQSQLKETELRYYASNLNHSDSGKGKSSSKTPFIYNRFITPQKSDDIASMKISGFFITLAYTMILFTYVKTLATISITDYIVGRWKAMFAGLKGSWSNAIYYSILTWFWGLIVTFIPTTFQFGASIITEASKILSDSALGTAGGFGVGLGVLCVAWILTYPFVQVADKKISLIVGLVYMFDVVRLAIKGWLFGRYGLDSIIYQDSGFGAGALLGLATGGLLGAKQDLQQRIGGVKNSFGNGIDGLGASPTSDIDDSNPNNSYSPNGYDEPNDPDELFDENGNRRELTEEEKKRSPFRQGLGEERFDEQGNRIGEDGKPIKPEGVSFDENGNPIKPEGIVGKGRGRTHVGEGKPTNPNGMPTTPNKRGNPVTNGKGLPNVPKSKTKFDKVMSVAGKGAGIGLQVARTVTTASMSAIGMHGLTNQTNKAFDGVSKVGRGVGKAVAPQSPIRQAVVKNKGRLKDYVDNRRAKKPQPLGTGGKVPTVNEKPLTPKREGKIKPTIVNQEKPVKTPVVKDVYSPTVPQITRKDTMKPIKKPLRFPKNKRNKTRK
jgi:membrane protein